MQALFGVTMIPLSLGYNCHVKVFIDRIGESEERAYLHQPFDWVGSPMWSICEAVESDFSEFNNRELITLRKRFTDKPDLFLTHAKYNFCYLHDFGKDINNIPESKWTDALEKYERRIARWKTSLDSGNPLLFIRLESDFANRIEYSEFQREGDEKYYLEHFADLMKAKGVLYKILFLSTSYTKNYDKERHICTVQFGKKDKKDIIGGDQIHQIILSNVLFIRECLRTTEMR